MQRKHPHHLRSHRRRASLSQRDVAFLLGVRAISKISRYERYAMLPRLETALAYQVIFGRPVAQLFGGTYDVIRAAIRRRASRLAQAKFVGSTIGFESRRKGSLQAISRR
jgi:transcriptional regulator with XRE-family HTH domain